MKKVVILQLEKREYGVVAQLVERRTENPCVIGSTPIDATPFRGGGELD